MNCLLCSSSNTGVVLTRTCADLVREWKHTLDIDIQRDLDGHLGIELYRCRDCGLGYFDPTLALRAGTYFKLQQLPWYYLSDKWEYDRAIRDLSGVKSVVELGCGRGVFLDKLKHALGVRAVGLDTNEGAVAEGRARGLEMYAVMAAEYASDHRGEFDAACLFQVLEHVPVPVAFMNSVVSLVKAGGAVVISVPNADSFLRANVNILDMAPHHITKWNRKTLERLAALCGVRCVAFHEEPLSVHHVDMYVDAWIRARQGGVWGAVVSHWRVRRLLTRVVGISWLRPCLRGQTIYMFGVKT